MTLEEQEHNGTARSAMNLVTVRYKSYERKLSSSPNKLLPSLLLTVDIHSSVSAATDTVTHKVCAQIVDVRPKRIASAGSVANWVTSYRTAGRNNRGHLPGSTVASPARIRPKLHHSGSNKNRSSHCKVGIWKNGDCHGVGRGVLKFAHSERCGVTCSWSYEGMIHSHTADQDCLKRSASSTRFCMHTNAVRPLEAEA